jgi:hypothetical protein
VANVSSSFDYRADYMRGNYRSWGIDDGPQTVRAAEGSRRRLAGVGHGQELGGNRSEFDESHADRQSTQIGPEPRSEVG